MLPLQTLVRLGGVSSHHGHASVAHEVIKSDVIPARSIVQRLNDLWNGVTYVHAPTFVPSYGPYNRPIDPDGNPPTLNVTHWHVPGPHNTPSDPFDVLLGCGIIFGVTIAVFTLLTSGRNKPKTLSKEWKAAEAKRNALRQDRAISSHKVGKAVTVYNINDDDTVKQPEQVELSKEAKLKRVMDVVNAIKVRGGDAAAAEKNQ